jgi:hypothetical protein
MEMQNSWSQIGVLESLDDSRAFGVVFGDIFKGEYKIKTHGLVATASPRLINYNILLFEALEKLTAIGSLHVLTTCTNIKFS